MTEKEITADVERLLELAMLNSGGKADPKASVEAAAIAVRLASSTLACLHRIADALESGRPFAVR
jgi:hypothetical protein